MSTPDNALARTQVYHNYVTLMYLNGVILHTCQTVQTELTQWKLLKRSRKGNPD